VGIVPNQLPTIVVHRVHNADGPGPHDNNFNRVQALKLFEPPDDHDNPRGRVKGLRKSSARHHHHAFERGPLPIPSGYHLFKGGEI